MLLLVDNGSSYTSELASTLADRGEQFERRRPDRVGQDYLERFDSFILSGRQRNDRHTNMVNSMVIRHAIRRGAKLLGVCYGAQMLALVAGGTIRRVKPVRGIESVRIVQDNPLSNGTMQVFESHGYEISKLPVPLISVGASDSCRHEVVRYGDVPVFGTQFHPEMSSDGRAMIGRFCDMDAGHI